MKRFHSADQRCSLVCDHVCWFSDTYTFICRGGTLAAGQTNGLSFGGLIGQQISDVEVRVATMLALCFEILTAVVKAIVIQSGARVQCYILQLWWRVFASIGMSPSCPFLA